MYADLGVLARLRALASAALEVQRADSEERVFAAVGRAILSVGLNVHIETFDPPRESLIIRHVALRGDDLSRVERLLGRPFVGVALDPERVLPYRQALSTRRVAFVPSAHQWLLDAAPWVSERAARIFSRMRDVGQGACAPLLVSGEPAGALSCWGPELTEEDLPTVEIFAAHAGLALETVALRRAEKESAMMEGVLLAARTTAHEVNNRLAGAVGWLEFLLANPSLSSSSREQLLEVDRAVEAAARWVQRFQSVRRLELTDWPELPPTIDVERSLSSPRPITPQPRP